MLLFWLMLAGLAWYLCSASGTALTAARKFNSQAWFTVLVVLATLSAGLWLIPLWGLIGAAQSLLVGALLNFILQTMQVTYVFLQNNEK